MSDFLYTALLAVYESSIIGSILLAVLQLTGLFINAYNFVKCSNETKSIVVYLYFIVHGMTIFTRGSDIKCLGWMYPFSVWATNC